MRQPTRVTGSLRSQLYFSVRTYVHVHMYTWTYCMHVPILVPIFSAHAWFVF